MKTICKILAALALVALMFAEGDTFAASLAIKAGSIGVLAVCGEFVFKSNEKEERA